MTTVIEEMEAQDNSPKVLIEKLMAFSESLQSWFRLIDREVDSARSTHFVNSVGLQQYPPSDFVIEIKTTKSAISDKRFEILMDNPPKGYAVMGKQKSRKDATILYQYVRLEELSLSQSDCVQLARKSQLEGLIATLEENTSRCKLEVQQLKGCEISVRDANSILDITKKQSYYNSLSTSLSQVLEYNFSEDSINNNRNGELPVNLAIITSLVNVTEAENICYSMRISRLVSDYSQPVWFWRNGDVFPNDVMWKLRRI